MKCKICSIRDYSNKKECDNKNIAFNNDKYGLIAAYSYNSKNAFYEIENDI